MIRGRQRSRGRSGGLAGPTETIVLAWDPLYKDASITLSNANKTATAPGSWDVALGTVPKSGPVPNPTGYGPWWYFEVTVTSANTMVGICQESQSIPGIQYLGYDVTTAGNTRHCGLYSSGALFRDNSNPLMATSGFAAGDVVGCAYSVGDTTTRVRYYKNGVSISTDMLGTFFGGPHRPAVSINGASATISNNLYATPADCVKLGL